MGKKYGVTLRNEGGRLEPDELEVQVEKDTVWHMLDDYDDPESYYREAERSIEKAKAKRERELRADDAERAAVRNQVPETAPRGSFVFRDISHPTKQPIKLREKGTEVLRDLTTEQGRSWKKRPEFIDTYRIGVTLYPLSDAVAAAKPKPTAEESGTFEGQEVEGAPGAEKAAEQETFKPEDFLCSPSQPSKVEKAKRVFYGRWDVPLY
mmetsp:Transcript_7374/g.24036  ORF Transcript_7374/g.24036 Transcript_7374/m.24036 type:complete len:209 (+) Transcript_7374:932-1558(+)